MRLRKTADWSLDMFADLPEDRLPPNKEARKTLHVLGTRYTTLAADATAIGKAYFTTCQDGLGFG